MTLKEFGVVVNAIKTYYPKEKILPTKEALGLWYEHLKDIDYDTMQTAVKRWVSLNNWSPTIADLRKMSAEIEGGQLKDWASAWNDVREAIRKYGMYNEEHAMASLDELTREVVRHVGYKRLCLSENIVSDRANFRDIYTDRAELHAREMQLSENLRLENVRHEALPFAPEENLEIEQLPFYEEPEEGFPLLEKFGEYVRETAGGEEEC